LVVRYDSRVVRSLDESVPFTATISAMSPSSAAMPVVMRPMPTLASLVTSVEEEPDATCEALTRSVSVPLARCTA
jgi:hypothetical protein